MEIKYTDHIIRMKSKCRRREWRGGYLIEEREMHMKPLGVFLELTLYVERSLTNKRVSGGLVCCNAGENARVLLPRDPEDV